MTASEVAAQAVALRRKLIDLRAAEISLLQKINELRREVDPKACDTSLGLCEHSLNRIIADAFEIGLNALHQKEGN